MGAEGPLNGIRVVALEQSIALPYGTFALAEMGAEVIKIERPRSGDVVRGWDHAVQGLSTGFVWVNADKLDISIDVSTQEGASVVRRLVASADVFVENFAPGVVERLGLGYETLASDHQELIYCSLSGYGQDGPYRNEKAYDLIVQGESGILLTNGAPDAPAKVGLPITDIFGGMMAVMGILGALRTRDQTGRGQYLDIAMLDAAVACLGYFPQHYWHGGDEPLRTGMRHQYLCPYGPYLAADGQYVNLVVASGKDWERFATYVVQRPDWLTDHRFATIDSRKQNRRELEAAVEAAIVQDVSAAWMERLRAAGLPCGEVRNIASVLQHPQLQHRSMFVQATSEVGELPIIRFPLGDVARERHIPKLSEHLHRILSEAGYGEADRQRLIESGAVEEPRRS